MLTEPVRIVSARHLQALRASRRRFRASFGLVVSLALALGVTAAGRPSSDGRPSWGPLPPADVPRGGADNARAICQARSLPAAVDDPIYDQYLQQYDPLRGDAEGRRYVTAQVLAAAALHRVDSDLLFAFIGADSTVDSRAAPPKGARGLGQMFFATVLAAPPGAPAPPEDLYDMPHNLSATAFHLRQLLRKTEGDLRSALRAYYAGLPKRGTKEAEQDQYVAGISTRYAHLKTKRTYHCLNAGPTD